MALFKNLLISHDIMKFENDYLILHCSREGFVKAPFDGELTCGNTTCILNNGEFSLYISHINVINVQPRKVKASDIIGRPIVDNKYGQNIAYIGIKLYKADKLQDVLIYLKLKDNTTVIKKEEKKINNEEDDKKITLKKSVQKSTKSRTIGIDTINTAKANSNKKSTKKKK